MKHASTKTHAWVSTQDGRACAVCGIRETWPGARDVCTGVLSGTWAYPEAAPSWRERKKKGVATRPRKERVK